MGSRGGFLGALGVKFLLKSRLGIGIRDGHAEAKYAEVCGLMRICDYAEAMRKTQMCMRHRRQKNKVKNRTKLGRRRARAKTVKILNKNSRKSIKNRPKNGPKMVIFFY